MKIGAVSGDMVIKLALGVAVLGLGYVAYKKLTQAAGSVYDAGAYVADATIGAVTGDNALTRGATNSDGTPQTAYQGVPVVGTLGAAANAASGGYLADFGGWLGRKTYDLTHSDPLK